MGAVRPGHYPSAESTLLRLRRTTHLPILFNQSWFERLKAVSVSRWGSQKRMPPVTSRDFIKVAEQRLTAAEALFREKLTLDARYIGDYVVECALKALILEFTPDENKAIVLSRITSGARMHDPEVLKGELKDRGIDLPLDLARKIRRSRWTPNLRYETGRLNTSETVAFLKTANAVLEWAKGQLT